MGKNDQGRGTSSSQPGVGAQDFPRRRFLAGTAGTAVIGALAGWTPVFRIDAADAQESCTTPPNFPSGIPLYLEGFQNWSEEITVASVWTCTPKTPADVVTIANWAYATGYKMRPRGMMHNWSPLTIAEGTTCDTKVVLVDTTQYLTAVSIDTASTPNSVTAQAGVTMDTLLQLLENAGLGVTATPAPGDITVGGVLAIDGHGTAVPAIGETLPAGHTYGSLSNLILSLTAVVWNPTTQQYGLQTFSRTDPDIGAILVHLGRTFITEATLQVGANQRLRCQSLVNVPATELFAPQGSSGRTFASYIDSAGRVEAIWYPFTSNPWLKVWSVSPTRPLTSREVIAPYNYPFSDVLPESVVNLVEPMIEGQGWITPSFGQAEFEVTAAGLLATLSADIWGWSKNLLLYIKPTTLRVTANGYAVLTARANIQRVINDFIVSYQARVAAYQANGDYPMNGPVEIRVTGLDQVSDVLVAGAEQTQISALRPRPDQTQWDVAVWFDILTIPGTPNADQFYRDTEQFMFSNYTGDYAMVRPEWSKGWAYTATAAWADPTMLSTTIPNAFRVGQPADTNWDATLASFDQYDPNHIFASPLTDSFLP